MSSTIINSLSEALAVQAIALKRLASKNSFDDLPAKDLLAIMVALAQHEAAYVSIQKVVSEAWKRKAQ